MIKISIIVPIYNVEKYIDKCLNSLFNQTLKDIEIIAVNDGSTDKSYNIAKKYNKKENFTLINNTNHGLGYSRNCGLKKAKGKYIMFMDSDDYADENLCEQLYNFAENKKADIVCYDLKYIYHDHEHIMSSGYKENMTYTEYMLGPSSAACKMYKNSFLNSINFEFPAKIWSEDIAIIPSLCIHTNKIYYNKNVFYNYVQRNNSITNQTKYNKKSIEAYKAIDLLVEIFKNNNCYERFKDELEYIYITNLLLNIPLKIYTFKEGKKDIKKLSRFMKEEYPHWYKNKYFKTELTFKQKIYCILFYLKLPSIVNLLYKIKNILKIRR